MMKLLVKSPWPCRALLHSGSVELVWSIFDHLNLFPQKLVVMVIWNRSYLKTFDVTEFVSLM